MASPSYRQLFCVPMVSALTKASTVLHVMKTSLTSWSWPLFQLVYCFIHFFKYYIACVASVSNQVIAQKLERKPKKGWRGRGRREEETLARKPQDSTLPAPRQPEAAFAHECSFSKSWGLRASGSLVPLPSPVIHFFLLLSQLSRRTSRGNACYAG